MWQEVVSLVPDTTVLRRLLFAAVQIPKSTPHYSEIVNDFAFGNSKHKPSPEKTKVLLENLEFLNEKAFGTDKELFSEFFDHKDNQGQRLGIVLISNNTICKSCGGKLRVRRDRPTHLTLYTDDMGTVPATHFRKSCSNSHKGCTFTQHYGFHYFNEEHSTTAIADDDWAELPYFISTSKTGFSMAFLERFDAELLLGQVSYKQKSDIYNFYKYEKTQKKCQTKAMSAYDSDDDDCRNTVVLDEICARAILDRRRLEEGHMKYAVLRVYKWYPKFLPAMTMASSIQQILEDMTPTFYNAFSMYYSTHQCRFPGCTQVLVLDGNMKNRRDICAASEAGYIEYKSLPGTIKTGCQLSPMRTSKYCFNHAPRVSKVCAQDCTSTSESTGSASEEGIVKVLLAKKVTRNSTLYQVAWLGLTEKVTWEPASTLPKDLIEEFEAGTSTEESVITAESYGAITHTHTMVTSKTTLDGRTEPLAKRAKISLSMEKGIFEETDDDNQAELACNTLKDKGIRIHDRSAGVLAGMWPCGILIMLKELFIAESKAQVYAALHELLSSHPNITTSLQFVCYDDGCHLRRYARNPCRSQITPCSVKLANVEIVIDKMHMAGHTDKWCHQYCNPRAFKELENVDTEVCEQHFSWLSKYAKITRRMNRNTFIFFLLYITDMHNRRELLKLQRGGFL